MSSAYVSPHADKTVDELIAVIKEAEDEIVRRAARSEEFFDLIDEINLAVFEIAER